MFSPVIVLIFSFLISFLLIPSIIHLASKNPLYVPVKQLKERRNIRKIAPLGGIGIFIAFGITSLVFVDLVDFPANYFAATSLIIILVGLNDDLLGVRPMSRLIAESIIAFIIVVPGKLSIATLGGIFGIHEMPYPLSVFLSMLFIVGLINAFNLVDGIDGLAAALGLTGSFTFAYLFFLSGHLTLSLTSLALFGSLLGFFVYNFSPAKIFMGDSGAYFLGFIFAIFALSLINILAESPVELFDITINSPYSVIAAILMLPVFDAIRVFALRIYNRTHPFEADTNHIHHRLLNMGLSHRQIVLTYTLVTFLLLAVSLLIQELQITIQLAVLLLLTIMLNFISYYFYLRHQGKTVWN